MKVIQETSRPHQIRNLRFHWLVVG